VTGGQPSGDTEIASVLDAQLPLIPPERWPSPFRANPIERPGGGDQLNPEESMRQLVCIRED